MHVSGAVELQLGCHAFMNNTVVVGAAVVVVIVVVV
jgi:hypothetical protein